MEREGNMRVTIKNRIMSILICSLITLLAGFFLIYSIGFKSDGKNSHGYVSTVTCTDNLWVVPNENISFDYSNYYPYSTTKNATILEERNKYTNSEGTVVEFDSDIASLEINLTHSEYNMSSDKCVIEGNTITYDYSSSSAYYYVTYYGKVTALPGFAVIQYQNGNGYTTTESKSYSYGTGQKYLYQESSMSINMDALVYPRKFQISFDANGGTFPSGSSIRYEYVIFCDPYTTPEEVPTRSDKTFTNQDYVFKGWDIPQSGLFTDAQNGTKIKALWYGESYDMSFGENEEFAIKGAIEGSKIDWPTFEAVFGKGAKPPYEGYKFVGWEYIDANNGTRYVIEPGLHVVPNLFDPEVGKKFLPKYEPIEYKIEFDGNNNTNYIEMSAQYLKYDEEEALKDNVFERTGFKFLGWEWVATKYKVGDDYETIEIEPKFFENKQPVQNLITDDNVILVFKAKWEAISYFVVYHSNFEGSTYEPIQAGPYKYDEVFILPRPEFLYKKPGYYNQWSTKSELNATNAKVYQPGAEASGLTEIEGAVVDLYVVRYEIWSSVEGAFIEPEFKIENGIKTYFISSPENLGWLTLQFQKNIVDPDPSFDCFKGVNFVQTNDISLLRKVSSGSGWEGFLNLVASIFLPIGNENFPFMGNYDGSGCKIDTIFAYNMLDAVAIDFNNVSECAIFKNVKDGSIKNLNLKDSNVSLVGVAENCYIENCNVDTTSFGLIYQLKNSTVKNCSVKNAELTVGVTGSGLEYESLESGQENYGIIVSIATNSNIIDCNVLNSRIAGKQNIGIIAGKLVGGKIENCYSNAVIVEGETNVGFVGYAESATFKFCINLFGDYSSSSGTSSKPSYIKGIRNVSGLIGCVGASDSPIKTKIENCYVDYSAYDSCSMVGDVVGGLVGCLEDSGIEIFSSMSMIKFKKYTDYLIDEEWIKGAIVGDAKDTSNILIKNCISSCNVASSNKAVENIVFEEGAQITNTIIYTDNMYIYPGEFSNWCFDANANIILPSGLTWFANSHTIPVSQELLVLLEYGSAIEKGYH